MSNENLYVRTKDAAILSGPMNIRQIAASGHPLEEFLPFEVSRLENASFAYRYDFKFEVRGQKVVGVYVPVMKTLVEVINALYQDAPGEARTDKVASSITEEQRLVLQKAVDDFADKQLNDFVATKNYGSIVSAISYETSDVIQFKADALRVKTLRDQTWSSLIDYMSALINETEMLPKTLADVTAKLPTYTW